MCGALGISAKGPHVGQVINKMMDWQMLHMDQMLPLYPHPTPAHVADSAASVAASSAAASSSSSAAAPAAAAPSTGLSAQPVSASSAASADAVRSACFAWLSQFKDSFVADGKPARAK